MVKANQKKTVLGQRKTSLSAIRQKKNDILKNVKADSTKNEYKRVYKRICQHASQELGHNFEIYIENLNVERIKNGKKPVCRSTYYACKSALQYGLAKDIEEALSEYNRLQKEFGEYNKKRKAFLLQIKNMGVFAKLKGERKALQEKIDGLEDKIEKLKKEYLPHRYKAVRLFFLLEDLDIDYDHQYLQKRNAVIQEKGYDKAIVDPTLKKGAYNSMIQFFYL
ncbi:MAG: hypothetical protein GY710_19945 [Desulfobacteraceae bacterium]|nr:hypothetical protein [Desulfobacteraceae bacterium]